MSKIKFDNLVDKDGNTIELDLPSKSPEQAQERWSSEINEIRSKARRSAKEALSLLRCANKKLVWLEEQHINDRNIQELGKSFKFNDSQKKDPGEV